MNLVAAAIGLQSAGAVLVPLNTRLKGAGAAYILRKSGARLLCTVTDFLGTNYVELLEGQDLPALKRVVALRGSARGVLSWADFLEAGEEFP